MEISILKHEPLFRGAWGLNSKILFVLHALTANRWSGQDFWKFGLVCAFRLQTHCFAHKIWKLCFLARFNFFKARFLKIVSFCLFWPVLGKISEKLAFLVCFDLVWVKIWKFCFFCAFLPHNHCSGQNYWKFCFFVCFGRKTTVLDKIFENFVFFARFDRKTSKTPKCTENSGKIAGKQREDSGGIWPEQRENSGKTAGIGAQTAGIWKNSWKIRFWTQIARKSLNFVISAFFANFGWNSRFEAWFRRFATRSGWNWFCLVFFAYFGVFALVQTLFGYVLRVCRLTVEHTA